MACQSISYERVKLKCAAMHAMQLRSRNIWNVCVKIIQLTHCIAMHANIKSGFKEIQQRTLSEYSMVLYVVSRTYMLYEPGPECVWCEVALKLNRHLWCYCFANYAQPCLLYVVIYDYMNCLL